MTKIKPPSEKSKQNLSSVRELANNENKIAHNSTKPQTTQRQEPLLTIFTTFKRATDRFDIHANCLKKNWAILKHYVTCAL